MATALITGSYGGLGKCFVKLHASAGGDLILVGRSKKKLDEQKAQVEKTAIMLVSVVISLTVLPYCAIIGIVIISITFVLPIFKK